MNVTSLAATALSLAAFCTATSVAADATHDAPQDAPLRGDIDHVLVSLPSDHFAALDTYLSEHLAGSWFALPQQGKGFIVTQEVLGYIEIWDAGRAVFNWPLGSQIALTTDDIERGRAVAEAHYETPGRSWAEVGAPELLTVCPGDMADPLGGTFFVSYGPTMMRPMNPKSMVTTLKEVVTIIPEVRMGNNAAYRAFGFTEEKTEDGAVFTDTTGTRARVIGRDFFKITLPGHALLHFELATPVEERRVDSILDGTMIAIHDGNTLTLALTPDGVALANEAEAILDAKSESKE